MKQAPVDPTYMFEQRRFNRCYFTGWSDKIETNVGAVVQRDCKTDKLNTGWSDEENSKLNTPVKAKRQCRLNRRCQNTYVGALRQKPKNANMSKTLITGWFIGRRRFNRCYEKFCPSPERIFQLATLEKLDDRRAKSSPNLTKFCRHDHKGLVNISTEGIDESLHDLGGIEGLPSKNGVFSRTQKLRFERARES